MQIIIIGNGIAGISAARRLRQLGNADITVISEEGPYFYSRTALMYVYMGHMRARDTEPFERDFWAKNRINLRQARVERLDAAARQLHLQGGETMGFDKLVLATGSTPNFFGWPGQSLDGVQGLYHWQDLEALEQRSAGIQQAVIVGGGLIGVELAEMLRSRGKEVTFLVREQSFWGGVLPPEEGMLIGRHIESHGVRLLLNTELRSILGDSGRVEAVETSMGERIPCQLVGLTVGVRPNVDFLRESGLEIGRGILVNDFLETNLPDVYAVGDCVELRQPQPGRRPIEAVWYTGRMMGEALGNILSGNRQPYRPGMWFNSAKFFDIEYQVYGQVPAALPPDWESLYRESSDGQRAVRLVWERASGALVGIHAFGIRLRQAVCEEWILSGKPYQAVQKDIQDAHFDPELFPKLLKSLF